MRPDDLQGNMNMDEVAMAAPISVRDAASMLRRPIGKNIPPYEVTVIRYNNKLVDDWEERVLRKIANNKGQVRASDVWGSWLVYHEGIVIRRLINLMEEGVISSESDDTVEYCKNLLNLPIEEMVEYGSMIVKKCWDIVEHEVKLWCAERKYIEVYSQTEDPAEWYKLSKSQSELFNGRLFPFWSKEEFDNAREKVGTILGNPVTPVH